MSVTTTANRISHVSAGETTFAYDFLVDDDDWITVYHNGVLQSSGYSVTGVGNNAGGTVIHVVAVTAGVIVTIVRSISPTQLIAIPGGATKFPAESVETALDKLTMLIQQGADNQTLGIRWPITTPATVSGELFDPTDSTNWGAALVLNGTGTAIEAHPITGGGDIDVLTTSGDMVYFTGGSAARLPRGGGFYEMVIDPGTLLPSWQPPTTIKVADYFTPDGINDDWLNLQSVIADNIVTGYRVIELETNKTYNLSRTLIFSGSNWILEGNGAMIQALSGGFTGTAAANTSSLIRNSSHGYNNIPSVINSFINKNITIRNCRFSYNGEAAAGQGNICIWLRYVDGYLIENCTFDDCGDATGILACRNGLTNHCTATGFINAAFDHWDGCIDCGVTNCRVESTLTDTAQGIQFTGTGSLLENRDTVGCYAINNKVYGVRNTSSNTASAIIFNANDADSSVQNCVSAFNYIEDADLGVVFSGAGSNLISIGDTLKDVDQVPMFMQHANSDSPNYCRFLDTTLIDCDTVGNGLVTLTGVEPELRGLKVINSGAAPYPYIVSVASTATDAAISIQKAPDGDTGRVLNAGVTTKIYGEAVAYTPTLSFGGAAVDLTYTSQHGTYTRYGDVIHVRGTIVVNDNGSSSGGAAVSLPVTAATATLNGLGTCWLANASGLTSAVTGAITTGGTVMALYDHGATGAAVITESNIVNGATISFDACYRAAL